jgi:hypothetical protein
MILDIISVDAKNDRLLGRGCYSSSTIAKTLGQNVLQHQSSEMRKKAEKNWLSRFIECQERCTANWRKDLSQMEQCRWGRCKIYRTV